MSRHDKRLRIRELRKVIKAVEKRGPAHRPEMVELAALVSLLDTTLAKTAVPGRSAKAMALLARLLDKAGDTAPDRDRIACREGCTWCCDLYVSAPAPQIFAIADHVRENSPDLRAEISRLQAADTAVRGRGADMRALDNLFCPFLIQGRCGIYAVRPAACRAHASFSAEACEAAFRGESEEIPAPGHIPALRGGVEQALSTVLDHWRLPAHHYELTHAVLVALATPDAEARWYEGEDVFAEVGTDDADRAMAPEAQRREVEYREALWAVANGETPRPGPIADRFPAWCV